jgi:hypothetical protein
MRVLALVSCALACACGGPGSPSPAPTPGLTVDPSVSATVVASGLGTPDDLAVAADGTVYIGDEAGGRLSAWSPM